MKRMTRFVHVLILSILCPTVFAAINDAPMAPPAPHEAYRMVPQAPKTATDPSKTLEVSNNWFGLTGPLSFSAQYSQLVGYFLKAGWTQGLDSDNAFGVLAEAGQNQYRASGTLAHVISTQQRLKLSAEYLAQNLEFGFYAGKVNRWVAQPSAGLTYEYVVADSFLKAVHGTVAYSQVSSEDLDTKRYTEGTSIYDDYRRISGSTSKSASLGATVMPLKNTLLGIEANYDNVTYDMKHESKGDQKGLGMTLTLEQIITDYARAKLSASNRKPTQDYGAEINWLLRSAPGSQLELGLSTHKILSNQDDVQVGLNISYSFGGSSKAAAYQLSAPISGNAREGLSQFAGTPAVYQAQVLAVKDEAKKLVSTSSTKPEEVKAVTNGSTKLKFKTNELISIDLNSYFPLLALAGNGEALSYEAQGLPQDQPIKVEAQNLAGKFTKEGLYSLALNRYVSNTNGKQNANGTKNNLPVTIEIVVQDSNGAVLKLAHKPDDVKLSPGQPIDPKKYYIVGENESGGKTQALFYDPIVESNTLQDPVVTISKDGAAEKDCQNQAIGGITCVYHSWKELIHGTELDANVQFFGKQIDSGIYQVKITANNLAKPITPVTQSFTITVLGGKIIPNPAIQPFVYNYGDKQTQLGGTVISDSQALTKEGLQSDNQAMITDLEGNYGLLTDIQLQDALHATINFAWKDGAASPKTSTKAIQLNAKGAVPTPMTLYFMRAPVRAIENLGESAKQEAGQEFKIDITNNLNNAFDNSFSDTSGGIVYRATSTSQDLEGVPSITTEGSTIYLKGKIKAEATGSPISIAIDTHNNTKNNKQDFIYSEVAKYTVNTNVAVRPPVITWKTTEKEFVYKNGQIVSEVVATIAPNTQKVGITDLVVTPTLVLDSKTVLSEVKAIVADCPMGTDPDCKVEKSQKVTLQSTGNINGWDPKGSLTINAKYADPQHSDPAAPETKGVRIVTKPIVQNPPKMQEDTAGHRLSTAPLLIEGTGGIFINPSPKSTELVDIEVDQALTDKALHNVQKVITEDRKVQFVGDIDKDAITMCANAICNIKFTGKNAVDSSEPVTMAIHVNPGNKPHIDPPYKTAYYHKGEAIGDTMLKEVVIVSAGDGEVFSDAKNIKIKEAEETGNKTLTGSKNIGYSVALTDENTKARITLFAYEGEDKNAKVADYLRNGEQIVTSKTYTLYAENKSGVKLDGDQAFDLYVYATPEKKANIDEVTTPEARALYNNVDYTLAVKSSDIFNNLAPEKQGEEISLAIDRANTAPELKNLGVVTKRGDTVTFTLSSDEIQKLAVGTDYKAYIYAHNSIGDSDKSDKSKESVLTLTPRESKIIPNPAIQPFIVNYGDAESQLAASIQGFDLNKQQLINMNEKAAAQLDNYGLEMNIAEPQSRDKSTTVNFNWKAGSTKVSDKDHQIIIMHANGAEDKPITIAFIKAPTLKNPDLGTSEIKEAGEPFKLDITNNLNGAFVNDFSTSKEIMPEVKLPLSTDLEKAEITTAEGKIYLEGSVKAAASGKPVEVSIYAHNENAKNAAGKFIYSEAGKYTIPVHITARPPVIAWDKPNFVYTNGKAALERTGTVTMNPQKAGAHTLVVTPLLTLGDSVTKKPEAIVTCSEDKKSCEVKIQSKDKEVVEGWDDGKAGSTIKITAKYEDGSDETSESKPVRVVTPPVAKVTEVPGIHTGVQGHGYDYDVTMADTFNNPVPVTEGFKAYAILNGEQDKQLNPKEIVMSEDKTIAKFHIDILPTATVGDHKIIFVGKNDADGFSKEVNLTVNVKADSTPSILTHQDVTYVNKYVIPSEKATVLTLDAGSTTETPDKIFTKENITVEPVGKTDTIKNIAPEINLLDDGKKAEVKLKLSSGDKIDGYLPVTQFKVKAKNNKDQWIGGSEAGVDAFKLGVASAPIVVKTPIDPMIAETGKAFDKSLSINQVFQVWDDPASKSPLVVTQESVTHSDGLKEDISIIRNGEAIQVKGTVKDGITADQTITFLAKNGVEDPLPEKERVTLTIKIQSLTDPEITIVKENADYTRGTSEEMLKNNDLIATVTAGNTGAIFTDLDNDIKVSIPQPPKPSKPQANGNNLPDSNLKPVILCTLGTPTACTKASVSLGLNDSQAKLIGVDKTQYEINATSHRGKDDLVAKAKSFNLTIKSAPRKNPKVPTAGESDLKAGDTAAKLTLRNEVFLNESPNASGKDLTYKITNCPANITCPAGFVSPNDLSISISKDYVGDTAPKLAILAHNTTGDSDETANYNLTIKTVPIPTQESYEDPAHTGSVDDYYRGGIGIEIKLPVGTLFKSSPSSYKFGNDPQGMLDKIFISGTATISKDGVIKGFIGSNVGDLGGGTFGIPIIATNEVGDAKTPLIFKMSIRSNSPTIGVHEAISYYNAQKEMGHALSETIFTSNRPGDTYTIEKIGLTDASGKARDLSEFNLKLELKDNKLYFALNNPDLGVKNNTGANLALTMQLKINGQWSTTNVTVPFVITAGKSSFPAPTINTDDSIGLWGGNQVTAGELIKEKGNLFTITRGTTSGVADDIFVTLSYAVGDVAITADEAKTLFNLQATVTPFNASNQAFVKLSRVDQATKGHSGVYNGDDQRAHTLTITAKTNSSYTSPVVKNVVITIKPELIRLGDLWPVTTVQSGSASQVVAGTVYIDQWWKPEESDSELMLTYQWNEASYPDAKIETRGRGDGPLKIKEIWVVPRSGVYAKHAGTYDNMLMTAKTTYGATVSFNKPFAIKVEK